MAWYLAMFMEADIVDIQEKIRELRLKTGWTQEDLARTIDVSLSTMHRWEVKRVNPTRLARRALKKVFQEVGIDSD